MRVLVTGATGFLGNNLVRTLVEREDAVSALVRPTSNLSPLKQLPIEVQTGDLQDKEALIKAARGRDVVFHRDLGLPLLKEWKRKSPGAERLSLIVAIEGSREV